MQHECLQTSWAFYETEMIMGRIKTGLGQD